MRNWLIAASAGGVGSIVVVMSCVNDQSGSPAGADGGVCFPNGTCSAGLVCTSPQGNGICVPGEVDASSDGETSDAAKDAVQEDAPPIVCNPNVDASDLPPYCAPTLRLCFPVGTDAATCIASNGACNGGSGVVADCVGDTRDGSTCCVTGEIVGDASCAVSLDLVDGSILYSRPGNCISGTSAPADMLCTSTATCAKFDASSVCVPAVFSGTGTGLDGLQTGVCR